MGLFDSALAALDINGNPNARVFPDPVGALQQISLPSIASGMASHCTSKGSVKPSSSRATTKLGSIPKSENRTKICLCLARNPLLFSIGVEKNGCLLIKASQESCQSFIDVVESTGHDACHYAPVD